MPHISYRSNDFSILYFCPFKSFCFYTDYCALCKVLSCVPTAPELPPGNPALSSYTPRSDCGLYCCFLLSALIHISSQADSVLPHPYHIILFLSESMIKKLSYSSTSFILVYWFSVAKMLPSIQYHIVVFTLNKQHHFLKEDTHNTDSYWCLPFWSALPISDANYGVISI